MIRFCLIYFALTFFIFLLGISPSVFGGDNGDIILAAWFGGVAHPPGYPLNTLIGWIFTHLPIYGTVAYKANLMAAFMQAGAVVLIFLIIRKLTGHFISALASSLTLAFMTLFWLYAHTLEVFQLSFVLVGFSIYFLLQAFPDKKERGIKNDKSRKNLHLSILFLGLSVFHHQYTLLLVPPFLYYIYKKNKKLFSNRQVLGRSVILFLVGVIPYLFSIWAAFRKTPINWDDPSSFNGFIRLITRADYGTFTAAQSFDQAGIGSWYYQLLSYFGTIRADFFYVGIFFILIGAVFLYKKDKILFYFLTSSWFLTGPFFLIYAGFPLRGDFVFGIVERFVLFSYFFLVIFLGFGYFMAFELIKKHLLKVKLLVNKQLVLLIVELSFLLIPFGMFFLNWSKADLSNFKIGDLLGHDVLVSTTPKSMIFLFDDTVAFNTLYVYHTSSEFKDRKLFMGGSLKHLYYRKQIISQYSDLKYDDSFLSVDSNKSADDYILDLISNNPDLNVYSIGGSKKLPGYKWIIWGIPLKLFKEDSTVDSLEMAKVFDQFVYRGESIGFVHFIPQHIKSMYMGSYLPAGFYLLSQSNNELALELFERAKKINSDSEGALIGEGVALAKLNRCSEADENFSRFSTGLDQNATILGGLAEFYKTCKKDDEKANLYEDQIRKITGKEVN